MQGWPGEEKASAQADLKPPLSPQRRGRQNEQGLGAESRCKGVREARERKAARNIKDTMINLLHKL